MNEIGETSNEDNIDWIPNLHPKQGMGWVLMKGLVIGWIFSFISLIVIIWSWLYFSEGDPFDDMPWQIIYFACFANILCGSGVISIYYETVRAIYINKAMIKFRLNFGRIRSYTWEQLEYLKIGFDNENYIWIRSGKDHYDFYVPKPIITKIAEYYERETGRKPEIWKKEQK
jgi:hypothetical protein